jgi:hypothetical protein
MEMAQEMLHLQIKLGTVKDYKHTYVLFALLFYLKKLLNVAMV